MRWVTRVLIVACTIAFCAGKRAVHVCCEPVDNSKTCGANGYGYKWRSSPTVTTNLAASLIGQGMLAVSLLTVALCGWILIWKSQWTDGHRKEMMACLAFVAISLVGLAWTQLTLEKVLFLSPLGWMRVSNVFVIYLICMVLLNAKEEKEEVQEVEEKPSKQERAQYQIKWLELAKFGLFSITTYAQEKLLWSPFLSIGVPLLALVAVIKGVGKAPTSFVVLASLSSAACCITLASPFEKVDSPNIVQQSQSIEEQGWGISARTRLFWSTTWHIPAVIAVTAWVCLFKTRNMHQGSVAILMMFAIGWGLVLMAPHSGYLSGTGPAGSWCCLESTERRTGCAGGVWFHHNEFGPVQWTFEIKAMTLITVLTNASGIPATFYVWNAGSAFATVVGFSTIVYSTLYHHADTIDGVFAGMTEGNWHRLDNIFAILSFVNGQLYVMEASLSHAERKSIRTVVVLFTVLLQEIGPWQLECTLLPIFLGSAIFAVYLRKNPLVRAELLANRTGDFSRAFGLLFLGVLGFIRGLDQDRDYLRIGHGCWHLFTGFSFLFLSRGLHQVVLRCQTKSD